MLNDCSLQIIISFPKRQPRFSLVVLFFMAQMSRSRLNMRRRARGGNSASPWHGADVDVWVKGEECTPRKKRQYGCFQK